jgi:hypothetical protein
MTDEEVIFPLAQTRGQMRKPRDAGRRRGLTTAVAGVIAPGYNGRWLRQLSSWLEERAQPRVQVWLQDL